jgi:hypothetical protein
LDAAHSGVVEAMIKSDASIKRGNVRMAASAAAVRKTSYKTTNEVPQKDSR